MRAVVLSYTEEVARVAQLISSLDTLTNTNITSHPVTALPASKQNIQLLVVNDKGREEQLVSVAGIFSYLFFLIPHSPLEAANFISWVNFVESEIMPYRTNDKNLKRNLQVVSETIEQWEQNNRSGAPQLLDVYLAAKLLEKNCYSCSSGADTTISSWMTRVLQNLGLGINLLTPAVATENTKLRRDGQAQVKPGKNPAKQATKIKSCGEQQEAQKLKILCLHGYRQSGPSFRSKLGSFRKHVAKLADFTFMTAPHQISGEGESGWWFSTQDRRFDAHQVTDCDLGIGDSLASITQTVREQGPFHGILSFSQGAALGGELCLLQELCKLDFSFHFAILVAGFIPRATTHSQLFHTFKQSQKLINIPTLHVYGETDKVICSSMSEELSAYFREPTLLTHEGGHFLPTSPPARHTYTQFLIRCVERLLS